MKNKQLKRLNKNKILFGVIGGLAEYFEIDVVLARLVFITLLVITGFFPFGIVYILAAVIIPEEHHKNNHHKDNETNEEDKINREDEEEVVEAKFVDNK